MLFSLTPFFFWFSLLAINLYFLYALGHSFHASFLYILLFYLSKSKKFSFSGHFVGLALFSKGFVNGCNGNFVDKKRRKACRTTLLCLFWTIWKKKTQRTFEEVQCTIQSLKDSLTSNLYMWSCGYI